MFCMLGEDHQLLLLPLFIFQISQLECLLVHLSWLVYSDCVLIEDQAENWPLVRNMGR